MEIEACLVRFKGEPAGLLIRVPREGYIFNYLSDYLNKKESEPISLSLPLRAELYKASKLFPFFEGLLSEGWLKRVQSRAQKIDENDSFRLLMENGKDLIGAVSLEKIEINNDL